MGRENLEGAVGEIRGCLSGVKGSVEDLKRENIAVHSRLGAVEQKGAANEQRIVNIEENFERECEERQREKDREQTAVNTKIAVVALVITVVNIIIGVAFRLAG